MLQKLYQNKKWLIITDQIVFSGTTFLTTLVIARNLDKTSFGVFSGVVLGLYFIISMVSGLVIQPFQVSDQKNKETYKSFTFWLEIVCIAFLSIILYVILISTKQSFNISLWLFGVGFTLNDYARKILLSLNKLKETLYLDILVSLIQILSTCWLVWDNHLSVENIYIYQSCSYVLSILILIIYVKPYNFNDKDWKGYWFHHLKEGKWLVMSSLVQWGASNLFVVASGVYIGVQALGALRLVQSLFGLLNMLLQVFENYIIPQTSYHLSKSTTHAISYLAHSNKQAFYWFGLILLLFTLFSEYIIVMAGGSQYEEYAFLINGMVILYVLIFINQPIRIAIRVLILNQYFFYGYLISFAFTIISFDFMLSNWGLMGVLSGLICSQIILILFWQSILLTKKFAIWKSFI
ncbi:MAG: hypothetical protein MUC49_00735 [Raineya sp.]|jgi:O-antigen/teichoic acid export membrane protein|nr:hypothetical protein [Raineya sp.]